MCDMAYDSLMVFSGNANPKLAADVVKRLNISLGRANVGRFSDGEISVEIHEHVRGKDAWVVGGGQVYDLAMPYADVLVVTTIDTLTEADTFAPEVDLDEWRLVDREPAQGWTTAANGMRFEISRYERYGASGAASISDTVTNR